MSLSFATATLAGCTKDQKHPSEPVAGAKPAVAPGHGAAMAEGTAPAKAAPAAPPPADPNCVVLDKLPSDPPVVVPGKNIVLTRLMKSCVAAGGKHGYDKATPYLAMGFPCTGGSGRVDIKGHYANPHMVSFILGTDCGMAPSNSAAAQAVLTEAFGLPKEARLAAYTPFVVQYWEVPGMTDADTGYAVELRSAPAKEGLWRKFQQGQPVPVRLYGRENTWVQGGSMYFVEGDIRMTGRTAFQLQVRQVKPLTKEEVEAVKGRCEALRPPRNCSDFF